MIRPEPITVDGRQGVVVFLDEDGAPVDPQSPEAVVAKAIFDDGGRAMYAVQPKPTTDLADDMRSSRAYRNDPVEFLRKRAGAATGASKLVKYNTVREGDGPVAIKTVDLFGKPPVTMIKLPLNLKTTKNARAKVPLEGLEPTQETIPVAGLRAYLVTPRTDPVDVVHVVMRDGRERHIIQEGHTRAGVARIHGDDTVDARVWEFTQDARGDFVPVVRGLQKRGEEKAAASLSHRQKLAFLLGGPGSGYFGHGGRPGERGGSAASSGGTSQAHDKGGGGGPSRTETGEPAKKVIDTQQAGKWTPETHGDERTRTTSKAPPGTAFSVKVEGKDIHVPQAKIDARIQEYNDDPDMSQLERDHAHILGRQQAIVDYAIKEGGGNSAQRHALPSPKKGFTKERRELHRKILAKLMTVDKDGNPIPRNVKDLQAIFFGGPSGGGKGSLKANVDTKGMIVIDADDIKAALLKESGLPMSMAAYVHEESSIVAKMAMKLAMRQRSNFVLDGTFKSLGTGDNDNKILEHAMRAKSKGYTNEAHIVDLPVSESARRVAQRFLEGDVEKPGDGRFVPPKVAREHFDKEYGTKSMRAYKEVQKKYPGLFKRGRVMDTRTRPSKEIKELAFDYDDKK